MGYVKIESFIWVLSILSLGLLCVGFNPSDNYLIDCGSPTNTTVGDRVFVSDRSASKFLSTPQDVLATTTTTLKSATPSGGDSPLYQTARIFTEPSKYTFSIAKPGRHWIRLYFAPFDYQTYSMSSAKFGVSAGIYTLLSEFTVSAATVKEYSVNAASDTLVLTFAPSGNSFAFVNAIEVVSVPDSLVSDDARSVDTGQSFSGLPSQAMETVFRVNMGGPAVLYDNDTLSRTWVPDQDYLLTKNGVKNVTNFAAVKYPEGGATEDIAPRSVYGTATAMNADDNPNNNYNVTWEFSLDQGFRHFVRFHFCDIESKSLGLLYFNVYIDSWIVAHDLDLSQLSFSVLATAMYSDFVTAPTATNKLRVSIGPSTLRDVNPNAILNGLEIMKLNNSVGSLSSASGSVPAAGGGTGSKMNVGVIAGVSAGALVAFALGAVVFVVMCRRKRGSSVGQGHSKSWIPLPMNGFNSHTAGSKYSTRTAATSIASNQQYRIPFAALQEATNGFDEARVIGVGGFGKVYKAELNDGTQVAVKRGNPRSQQGLAEFQTEIEMLSQFRHRHLVSLIGYCDEKNEMILVYEYMENGTLKSHLYGSGLPSLTWKQRLEACIGAARGLHYLHTGYAKAVIHRDVKSANILLDENLMAKVADFGLSKAGPEIDQTHVSTAVKGSFGYLDPEYFRRQQLTDKSDVYSFGVVLFEAVCARPVIDPTLPRDMVNLAEWAMKWQTKGQLDQIIDQSLVGRVRADSLRKFGETAEKCLSDYGVDRPTMGDVLWNLEYALQLQLQEAEVGGVATEENSTNVIGELSPRVNDFGTNANADDATVNGVEMTNLDDLSGVSMSRVFSQLVKSEGR